MCYCKVRINIGDSICYITAVALCCLGSVNFAGCIVIGNIVCEAMTELVDFRISIRITANITGMCCKSVCRAGRVGYNACIIMFTCCRDFRF